jgi:hypothetical protein
MMPNQEENKWAFLEAVFLAVFIGFSKKSHFGTFRRPKMAYEVGPNLWT